MDFHIYSWLNGLAERSGALETVCSFFAQDGQILFLALLGGLFLARGKWRTRNGRHGVAAAGFGALLALGAAQVIGMLWDRPRPYALGTHYPTDVAGGALLGAATAAMFGAPPLRRVLNRLADWTGSIYDRVVNASLRSLPGR